jgi:tRNA (adenine-N(1)-)-methyltransferase non-catalytic subunit
MQGTALRRHEAKDLTTEAIIKEGDMVICRMYDEKSTTLLRVTGEQKVCKTYVNMRGAVGSSYGTVFNVVGKELEPASATAAASLTSSTATATTTTTTTQLAPDKDNRSFSDTNTSQKLKDADIKKMRSQGTSGEEIIKTLIANSDTWATKTEFSQEKWLKKKQRKYMKKMRLIKCTPATVCEVYHAKNRDKICHLRPDSLAQLLSHSGIYPGCRVLIVDSVVGLVVGSVAYRMRGLGQIFALYYGQQPHFQLVDALNLDEGSTRIIQPAPSNELAAAAHDVRARGFVDVVHVPSAAELQRLEADADPDHSSSSSSAEAEAQAEGDAEADAEGGDEGGIGVGRVGSGLRDRATRPHNKSGRHPQDVKVVRQGLREGFDSLILASRFAPLPILREALSLLLPSSPFVVFFEFVEPLVECFLYLQEHHLALRLSLSDTWQREFQTLPNRVHPQMHMSSASGYILSGVYVGVAGAAAEQV